MSKKRSMADALTSTLQEEEDAVKKRFEKAEAAFEASAPQRLKEVKRELLAEKVVRDTFSLPSSDYDLIEILRKRCLKAEKSVTKSEVVRAGLRVLSKLSNQELLQAIDALTKMKPGRPKVK